ncbi:MAG TPA: hypothetical protein VM345_13420 [Acidimicrobiales bacterium]|nr:hypothetical protein [Acidimicrobiales bacterium]
MGTLRTASMRRVWLAMVAATLVVFTALPAPAHAATDDAIRSDGLGTRVASEDGEGTPKKECPEGEIDRGEGECVPEGTCGEGLERVGEEGRCVPVCQPGETRNAAGDCQKPELEDCFDGTKAPPGACPAPPAPTPCPDGAPICGAVRSCPIDSPLPPGSTCEAPSSITLPASQADAPLPPSPSPIGDGGVFGRPLDLPQAIPDLAGVAGAGATRGAPPELARTGLNEMLSVAGSALVLVGLMLVRIGGREQNFAPLV